MKEADPRPPSPADRVDRTPGAGALRVSVRPGSRLAGEESISVEPGASLPGLRSGGPEPDPFVDGKRSAAFLDRRGEARAILVEGDGPEARRVRVLLGPAAAGPDGLVRREVVVDGWRVELELEPERRASLRDRARRTTGASGHGGPTDVRAIIPGRVVAVDVEPGTSVAGGQRLLVIEAMKMQNEIRAPRAGRIAAVAATVGSAVELGDLLVTIAARAADAGEVDGSGDRDAGAGTGDGG